MGLDRDGQSHAKRLDKDTNGHRGVDLDRTCGETVSGVVEIDRPVLEDGVMDFGDGACDGTATLTIGSEVYTIDL